MKAVILATRKGTRLLPLTKEIPQCLLKVGGRTILERQVEILREKSGVDEIMVITGYLSEKVNVLCQQLQVQTKFNPFYEVSWMALALWLVKEELKEGFVFLYSDILFDSIIVQNIIQSKEEICLAIKKNGLREEAEKVVEQEGVIKSISKDRMTEENGEFIGVAKFSKLGAEKLISELDRMARKDLNASLINVLDSLIKGGERVAACDIENASFVDIDFPQDLEKAEEVFRDVLE